jgi:hypothetical protein
LTGKFDLTNVNNMAFYVSGPKLLFETTEISTRPNSTQQESNYIYLYTTKFGTSIKIWLNRKFESTEFETMRVNCSFSCKSVTLSCKGNLRVDIRHVFMSVCRWYICNCMTKNYSQLQEIKYDIQTSKPSDK